MDHGSSPIRCFWSAGAIHHRLEPLTLQAAQVSSGVSPVAAVRRRRLHHPTHQAEAGERRCHGADPIHKSRPASMNSHPVPHAHHDCGGVQDGVERLAPVWDMGTGKRMGKGWSHGTATAEVTSTLGTEMVSGLIIAGVFRVQKAGLPLPAASGVKPSGSCRWLLQMFPAGDPHSAVLPMPSPSAPQGGHCHLQVAGGGGRHLPREAAAGRWCPIAH